MQAKGKKRMSKIMKYVKYLLGLVFCGLFTWVIYDYWTISESPLPVMVLLSVTSLYIVYAMVYTVVTD